jgi:hypothetical protein
LGCRNLEFYYYYDELLGLVKLKTTATGNFILVILESLLLSAHACFLWGGSSGTGCICIQISDLRLVFLFTQYL